MEESSHKPSSLLDLLLSLFDLNGSTAHASGHHLLTLFGTSAALLAGCFLLILWRRSAQTTTKPTQPPRPPPLKLDLKEEDLDDGKKRVTLFFGTQTGTAEGFAKVILSNFHLRLIRPSIPG
jgi:hypothetical protein